MKERGRKTGYESSPFACGQTTLVRSKGYICSSFFLSASHYPKQNSYFSAWNPGGLDFENNMGKSRTVSLWVQDLAGIALTFEERVRDNKERLYLVSGLILAQLDKADVLTVHSQEICTIASPSCGSVGNSLPFFSP
jgi:hypothetical protein